MVVPAGGGLVAASAGGPAQREGEAGAGDQPGERLGGGQAGQPGGLGDGQPDRGDAGLSFRTVARTPRELVDLVVSRLVPENRSSKIICLVRLAGEGLRNWFPLGRRQ